MSALYLIPVTLGDVEHRRVLPEYNRDVILSIRHFIVENVRTARRFLKKTEPSIVIDDLVFSELNKHTSPEEVTGYLAPLAKGESVGVISEAGCPAVADPGADVVAIAQRKGYKVVPLVGPSSILMSVMGSGFNGQSFAFHGYLPIDASQRTNAIKKLEGRIYSENQTQLFIETPYRNNKLAEELIRTCRPSTKLCIASNITCEDEYIHTRPVKEWAGKVPDLSKKPTIFLIYKNCNIGQNVVISPQVVLGDNVKVQNNVSVYTGVTCGDDVFLGPSCVFTNVVNPRSAVSRKDQYLKTYVGKGASIGANATIVCGHTIGEYAMIGAGAVVTKDIPPYALVVGNPSHRIGWVSEYGHRLSFNEKGIATCPESNQQYQLRGDIVTRIS